MLSELYGCSGWQMSFENHKAVGDWQALFGINVRCHHLSWYTMEGQAKRDYPASIFHQSAWYKDYKYVEDYFSRINFIMSQGKPVCDVLLVNPVESVWSLIYPKWSWQLGIDDPDVRKMEEIYIQMFRMLCGAKIDFDYGDEEIMSRLSKVVTENGQAYLKVGKEKYKTVIISGMLTIRNSTLVILRRFIKAGGKVIFAGEPPKYVNAVKSKKAVLENAAYTSLDKKDILTELKNHDLISVTDENGNTVEDIYAQVRKYGKKYFVMLMNINRCDNYDNLKVKINIGGYLEKWDVRSSDIKSMGYFEDAAEFNLSMPKIAEALFVISPNGSNDAKQEELKEKEDFSLPESFDYKLSEPNL
jgi:hypothetical protein